MWPAVVIIVALLLPETVGEDVPGVVSTSSYPSGEICGTRPARHCLTHASCSRLGDCQCPPGTSGDGGFQCYPPNTVHAQILGSSQVLQTFRNTSAVLAWPCRFRLTEFTTVRADMGQTCLFQIFGANQILGGRIATSGFEVHLQLRKGSGVVGGIGIRKEGKAANSVFTYTERGRNQYINEAAVTDKDMDSAQSFVDGSGSGDDGIVDVEENDMYDWGPPEELNLGEGKRVVCEVNEDNFATVSVPSCSTDVRFRAPSLEVSEESQTSGIAVTISKEHGPVVFRSAQTYLAETQTRDLVSESARSKNITVSQEVLHRAMAYAARQHRTPEGTECEDTARIYRSYCGTETQKMAALKSCSFFLENPDLVYCMDPPTERASSNSVNAFKLCLWNSCRPSSSVCSLLKSRVHQRGCSRALPVEFSGLSCDL
ncbi:hypothetical protein BsWGS_19144 [Bradybaena similaris]